jgi:hypothetical protein
VNNRRIECAKYPECLDLAAKENRQGFSCENCEAYVWQDPTDQERVVVKKEEVMEDKRKVCTKCGEEKDLDDFAIGVGRDGRKAQCKACDAKYHRELKKRKNEEKVKTSKVDVEGENGPAEGEQKTNPWFAVDKPDRLTDLVNAHWSYVEGLLKMHGQEEFDKGPGKKALSIIEYHYKTAMIHGYKHGQADAMSKS